MASSVDRVREDIIRRESGKAEAPPRTADRILVGMASAPPLTAALLRRQTPQGLAHDIGMAMLQTGDARDADGRIARLQAVRVTDVQRVLQQHVLNARRVTIDYTQGPAA